MSSEHIQNMDWTIQKERPQYSAEKKRQLGMAHLIWDSKLRKELVWKKIRKE